ncbi:serine hydrolase [Pseudactinotalea suaedae]|uniref:serine hydrolase n=1 Tax=Pseudactinotalea suaedae TaxID=1524924 RepID=UPI0019D68084|nr:serine hydrolase [Pseudactinotalea suaedae]
MTEVLGESVEAMQVAHEILERWQRLGLRGALLARNVDTSEQLGFAADEQFPLASVVKLPQALVLQDRIAHGRLDGAHLVSLEPAMATPGPTGAARFRHPARIAVEDLIYLTMSMSDNAAADALFALVPEDEVTAQLRAWGYEDIVIRHPMRALYDAVARWSDNDMRMALRMAAAATTSGGGHTLPVLDVSSGNVGTARALVTLVSDIWTDTVSVPAATARVRELMSTPVTRHRLGAELASDSVTVSSKTGTFLHARHEVGLVQTATGDRIAIAALTESSVPAEVQPEVDRAIGRAARLAVEVLRD